MDQKIKELVQKIYLYYCKDFSYASYIDLDQLTTRVISNKHHFNPTKGSFNTYFGTITNRTFIILYRKEKERIDLMISRDKKLQELLKFN